MYYKDFSSKETLEYSNIKENHDWGFLRKFLHNEQQKVEIKYFFTLQNAFATCVSVIVF